MRKKKQPSQPSYREELAAQLRCCHMQHNPPTSHEGLQPGYQTHTCPGCSRRTIFVVPRFQPPG